MRRHLYDNRADQNGGIRLSSPINGVIPQMVRGR